jgi:hypothetical protein
MTLRSTAASTAARIALAAMLAVGALGIVAQEAGATVTTTAAFPMILQEVPTADLVANTNGICTSGANLVIKNAQGTFNRIVYANAALACGLHVIWSFPDTVNYSLGRVYPSRVAALVNQVKNLPATWGYLSVKEPNWSHISGTEIRTLYHAFHTADPAHKVMVLFGDIPHFGSSTNPYTKGMANVVMVDWYPVETTNGTNSIYLAGASKWFPKVRAFVAKTSPGTPIYLMVQTHKYLRPATHKKQKPTQAQLSREVRDGLTYLHASGIAFHIWRNVSYTSDELRSPTMVHWMTVLIGQVHAGTFQ